MLAFMLLRPIVTPSSTAEPRCAGAPTGWRLAQHPFEHEHCRAGGKQIERAGRVPA